jgi:sugar O-acyltransferase (sialic acid O-acetyltransferase NeuD family)
MPEQPVLLFGASGHAKVIIDILEKQAVLTLKGIFDDNPELKGRSFFGSSILGGRDELLQLLQRRMIPGFVAIGANQARLQVAEWLAGNGVTRVNAVHPSAVLSRGVRLGQGIAVMANAVINADTTLGDEVIVNTAASIDHDCMIGAGTHIAPGARLCGGVVVGMECLIGAGATICPLVRIGDRVTIGAGTVVIADLPAGVTAVGNPARILEHKPHA